MTINIAELFVSLGIKGDGEAQKALSNVKSGLGEVQSSGLAAKAALLAVIYGLERLTGSAGIRGSALTNFALYTGQSSKELQKFEWAARRSGVASEELDENLKSVQKVMNQMAFDKIAPKGISVLAGEVGWDMSKTSDPFYVMKKVQEYVQKEWKNHPERSAFVNGVAESMGVSPNMVAGFRSGKFEPEKTPGEAILNDREIGQLTKVNRQWMEFWNTLQLFGQHQVAIFGPDVLKRLNDALSVVKELTTAFSKLGKSDKMLSGLGLAFTAIGASILALGAPLTALSSAILGIIYLMSEWRKHERGEKSDIFGDKNLNGNIVSKGLEASGHLTQNMEGMFGKMWDQIKNPGQSLDEAAKARFGVPDVKSIGGSTFHQNHVNNTTIHTDTKDPQGHADAFNKSVTKAYFKTKSLTQGN